MRSVPSLKILPELNGTLLSYREAASEDVSNRILVVNFF